MPRRVALPGAQELFRATEPTANGRRASGRVKHDEKITVYVSSDELLALDPSGMALVRWRVWRDYLAVVTTDGLLCVLYYDMLDEGWYLAKLYD